MLKSVPLNEISNDNIISEPLLINDNINTINTISTINTINTINNNNLVSSNKKVLVPTNAVLLTFKGKPLEKIEDKIICGSKRRKFPKKLSALNGFFMTLFLFLFFTILLTICLACSKGIPSITEELKEKYNFLICLIWISTIVALLSLIDAASSDPGRQRGTPIPRIKYDSSKIRKIVGGQQFSLKYCITCHIIRDIRTFHCDRCGLCIEKHDHHCGYLSNCVGVNNYRKFFIFINVSFIHILIIIYSCLIFTYNFFGKVDINYEWIVIFVIIIMLFGGIFEMFISSMIISHIITIVKNKTTREFIKHKEYRVYNRGCKKNCYEALCRKSILER